MNKQEFTYLLTHFNDLTAQQTTAVGDIVRKYPYFQPARALHLKGLKSQKSHKYNEALKITAAYTADRSILFDFITSKDFNQNEVSQSIKENNDLLKEAETVQEEIPESPITIPNMEDALDQYMKDSENALDPDLFQQKPIQELTDEEKKKASLTELIQKHTITPEEQLELGKPLEFSKNESHSFSEWLKITTIKPIERPEEDHKVQKEKPASSTSLTPTANNGLEKKLDLIDKFLSNNPKITPVKETSSSVNLAQTKLVQNDSLMTETLARIYLEQKNYTKAIQSYKILCLKYPEKSSFFADQIKAVKQLQQNNTK